MGRRISLTATTAIFTIMGSFAQDRKITVADCQFATNPEEFLNRSSRNRNEIFNRLQKFSASVSRRPAVTADSLPQRNFIDQEILGKLLKQNVPAAPVAADEEFFRRINLDLTGRIPSSEEVRAFLTDSDKDKRDAIIDKLLASPEFTDRWTMWMGDLLHNTATLTSAAINRAPQGRNTFNSYIKKAVASDRSLSKIATEAISATGNNYDTTKRLVLMFRELKLLGEILAFQARRRQLGPT